MSDIGSWNKDYTKFEFWCGCDTVTVANGEPHTDFCPKGQQQRLDLAHQAIDACVDTLEGLSVFTFGKIKGIIKETVSLALEAKKIPKRE